MMSSKFLNWEDFFRFSCFVMLVKYLLIALVRTDSSEIRLFFSININLLVFKPLLLKNGFMFFLSSRTVCYHFYILNIGIFKILFFGFPKRFTEKLGFFLRVIPYFRCATFAKDVFSLKIGA